MTNVPTNQQIKLSSFAALMLGAALLLSGASLLGILLPVRAHLDGFTPIALGLMGSAYYAGFVLGCLFTPQTINRIGTDKLIFLYEQIPMNAAILRHDILPRRKSTHSK
jgi:MFS family permease